MKMNWLNDFRSEPYRLLFPMGLAFGAIGMGIWIPFFFWPETFPYPGQGHAMIQLQGFMLCFILGFLGTMMPKILGIKPLGPWQFAVFPIGISALVLSAFLDIPRVSQALHLLVMFNFVLFIARRWKHRAGSPPPPFIFIGLAMAADIVGTCLRFHALSGHIGPSALRAGTLLQYQAFPLLLILGVGSFLLPKLFTSAVVDPQSLRGMPRGFTLAPLAMGLLFLATYALEAWGPAMFAGSLTVQVAHGIRAGIWAWFIFVRVRLHKVVYPQPAYLEGARLSLYAIGVGMVLPVLWPAFLLAWEHLVFIGGMMWLTLSIAARVVTAHGGRIDLLVLNRKPTLVYGALILAAMAVRVTTDIWITSRWLHMALAGSLGLAVLGLWAWKYFSVIFRFPGRPGRPA